MDIEKKLKDILGERFSEDEFWNIYYCIKLDKNCDLLEESNIKKVTNYLVGITFGSYITELFINESLYYFMKIDISQMPGGKYVLLFGMIFFFMTLSLYSLKRGKREFQKLINNLESDEKIILYYLFRNLDNLESINVLKKKFPDLYNKISGVF